MWIWMLSDQLSKQEIPLAQEEIIGYLHKVTFFSGLGVFKGSKRFNASWYTSLWLKVFEKEALATETREDACAKECKVF